MVNIFVYDIKSLIGKNQEVHYMHIFIMKWWKNLSESILGRNLNTLVYYTIQHRLEKKNQEVDYSVFISKWWKNLYQVEICIQLMQAHSQLFSGNDNNIFSQLLLCTNKEEFDYLEKKSQDFESMTLKWWYVFFFFSFSVVFYSN